MGAIKARRREVLVATDGALKGVQLPDFRHVIGYDLPKDVDSYGAHPRRWPWPRPHRRIRGSPAVQCSGCAARAEIGRD